MSKPTVSELAGMQAAYSKLTMSEVARWFKDDAKCIAHGTLVCPRCVSSAIAKRKGKP